MMVVTCISSKKHSQSKEHLDSESMQLGLLMREKEKRVSDEVQEDSEISLSLAVLISSPKFTNFNLLHLLPCISLCHAVFLH